MLRKIIKFVTSVPLLRAIPCFLIVPAVLFLLQKSGVVIPFWMDIVVLNGALLSCLLLLRGLLLVKEYYCGVPTVSPGLTFAETGRTMNDLQQTLVKLGCRIHSQIGYAEQGMRSIAMSAFLVSLGLFLAVGCYDNLFQFVGVVQVGTGDPAKLSDPSAYATHSKGLFFRFPQVNFLVKGVDRILPNSQYPYGASRIRILTADNKKIWEGNLAALGDGHTQNGYLFMMNSLEYNIGLIIKIDNFLLYTDWLHLYPMVKPIEGFTHHGELKKEHNNDIDGTALYNENTERLQLRLRHKSEHIDVELGEAPNHEKQVGIYTITNQGTARLSQIRVVRQRHKWTLVLLSGLAAVTGIASLFCRRSRIWFREEAGKGCLLAGDDPALVEHIRNVS